ncbi:hypothetical protein MP638_005812 [Amoeboaphelidium occidentale]|nr:hypothetical protein MP638_005812 [Amoeboaphelidium occidentale]
MLTSPLKGTLRIPFRLSKPDIHLSSIRSYAQKNLKPKSETGAIGNVGEYAPGWNPNSATASESNVKADRSADEPIDKFQEETIEWLEQRQKLSSEQEEGVNEIEQGDDQPK